MQNARRKVGQAQSPGGPGSAAEMRDAIRRKIGAAYASGDLATLRTLQNLGASYDYQAAQPVNGRVLDTYVPDQPSGRVLDTYVPDAPTLVRAPLPSIALSYPGDPTLEQYPPNPYYPCKPSGGAGGASGAGGAAGFLPGGSNAPQPWIDPCGVAWNESNKYCRATYKTGDAYGGYEYGATLLSGPGRLISLQAVLNPAWALTTPLYLLFFDLSDPSMLGSGTYAADKRLGPFVAGSIGNYEPYGEEFFEFVAPDNTVRKQAGGYPFDNGLYVVTSTDPTVWVSVGGASAPSNSGVQTGFALPAPFAITARLQVPIA